MTLDRHTLFLAYHLQAFPSVVVIRGTTDCLHRSLTSCLLRRGIIHIDMHAIRLQRRNDCTIAQDQRPTKLTLILLFPAQAADSALQSICKTMVRW